MRQQFLPEHRATAEAHLSSTHNDPLVTRPQGERRLVDQSIASGNVLNCWLRQLQRLECAGWLNEERSCRRTTTKCSQSPARDAEGGSFCEGAAQARWLFLRPSRVVVGTSGVRNQSSRPRQGLPSRSARRQNQARLRVALCDATARHPSPAFMSEGWWTRTAPVGTNWPFG